MNNTRYPDLKLDLTFRPVKPSNPRMLSAAQISDFNTLGYIAGLPLFSGTGLAELQQNCTDTAAQDLSPLNPHARLEWIYRVATNATLQGYLADLIGPDVVCFISAFIDKAPGSTREVLGHQDAAFNAMDARSVNVWIAVEDADVENGAMWFCPGSHKLGALPVRDPEGDLNLRAEVTGQVVASHGKVPIPVKAGHVLLFSDLLLHISPPNTSTRNRPALAMTFVNAGVRPHRDPRSKQAPVLCSGADREGNWDLLPPPGSY